MLPAPSGHSAHRIRRTRRELQRVREALARFWRIRTQPHSRTTCKRDTHDLLEVGYVAVPPQRRVGKVLGNHRVVDLRWRNTCPCGDSLSQRVQKFWEGRSIVQRMMREIVPAAEAHDAPFCLPLAVGCLRKGQRLDAGEQGALLLWSQEFRLIVKARGQVCRGTEEFRLCHPLNMWMSAAMARAAQSRAAAYGSKRIHWPFARDSPVSARMNAQ